MAKVGQLPIRAYTGFLLHDLVKYGVLVRAGRSCEDPDSLRRPFPVPHGTSLDAWRGLPLCFLGSALDQAAGLAMSVARLAGSDDQYAVVSCILEIEKPQQGCS